MKKANQDRIIYLEYLRAMATIAVILIHVASMNIKTTWFISGEWMSMNIYNSLSRWCVPIFVMISGVLFLDVSKNLSTSILYKKYILRIVLIFVVWTGIYTTIDIHNEIRKKEVIQNLIRGHYHMWYLILIIGLYILTPILREIVKNEKVFIYFVVVAIIMGFLLPQLVDIIRSFNIRSVNRILSHINYVLDTTNVNDLLCYPAFFMLGYYLNKKELSIKTQKIIYILGIIGLVMNIGLSFGCSALTREFQDIPYCSINVFMTTIAVFVFAKYHLSKINKNSSIHTALMSISKYSFGIYLIHPLILEYMNNNLSINPRKFYSVLSIPAITIVVFVFAYIASVILNRIPIVKKYLV